MLETIPSTKGTWGNVQKEVERLVLLGVLEVANDSEWVSPSFAQPKPKSNWVHFLSEFRNVNKKLKQKPHPMPKTNEMLSKLESVQYDTSTDLNMGCYYIWLRYNGGKIYTIIQPWGKYPYKRLSMGIANFPVIFQLKMNYLFYGFDFIRAYIDDLLILKKDTRYIMYINNN